MRLIQHHLQPVNAPAFVLPRQHISRAFTTSLRYRSSKRNEPPRPDRNFRPTFSSPRLTRQMNRSILLSERELQAHDRHLHRIQRDIDTAKRKNDIAARMRLEHELKDTFLLREIGAGWHRIGLGFPYLIGRKQHDVSWVEARDIIHWVQQGLGMATSAEVRLFGHRVFGGLGCVEPLRRFFAPLRVLVLGGMAAFAWGLTGMARKVADGLIRKGLQ